MPGAKTLCRLALIGLDGRVWTDEDLKALFAKAPYTSCFHKIFFSYHLETLGPILYSRWGLIQIKDYEAVLVKEVIFIFF